MERFEQLKNEYLEFENAIKDLAQDFSDFDSVKGFVVAAALRVWGKNVLYAPDYKYALEAVSGNAYSPEQIITAMRCCGDERELTIPDIFSEIIEKSERSTAKISKILGGMFNIIVAMAMCNGDFTIVEAREVNEMVGSFKAFAIKKGVYLPEGFFAVPADTAPAENYLKNDEIFSKEKKPASDSEPVKAVGGDSDKTPEVTNITINYNVGSNAAPQQNNIQPEKPDIAPSVSSADDEKNEETLQSLLSELDGLVGLDSVKKDVHSLINFITVTKMRKERGMKVPTVSYHLVFTGNPGTGKTTVARLVARLYYQLGILPKGQLVETDRSSLVAGYLGQTAIKTQKVIQEAMGGVLFIDEAYALSGETDDSYGKEAIETILKAMEDHRDELIVVVAGYTELMHKFIDSNPGLSSRFNKYFEFPDYSENELLKIYESFCSKNGYKLGEDAASMLKEHFAVLYSNRNDKFGNARLARNIFEKSINAQADRISENNLFSDFDLETITADDIHSVIGGK